MAFDTVKTMINVGKNISNDYTVPVSKIIENKKYYDVRLYEKNKYIVIKYRTLDSEQQVKDSKGSEDPVMQKVWKIMKYTQGDNDKQLYMKFYMPVFVKIETIGVDPETKAKQIEVKIMVSLPPDFQNDEPPKPNDPDIEFEILDQFKCFVKSFSGFAKDNDFKTETAKLKELVKKENSNNQDLFIDNECICISYDPPYKLFGRKNEVILISK